MKKGYKLLTLGIVALLTSCNTVKPTTSSNSSSSSSTTSTTTSSTSSSSTSSSTSSSSIKQDIHESELGNHDEVPYYYENRIILPAIGGSREVPDPFVYRFNGMYYLYPTTNGNSVKAYKSRDLIEWEPVDNGQLRTGAVYEYSSDGSSAPKSGTPFAPEVIYYNGTFYMIASPSGKGHYIFSSDSPEGPFTCITDNLGKSIDGSFFINSDEEIYLYGASSGSIMAYGLEDDFMTFKKLDNGNDIGAGLNECRVGNWNEGPYMLQKDGNYYLTYCGTHYLSASYRVDYSYAEEGSNLFAASAYKRQDNLIVSTEDDFKGLGHSATVLAPDLDSYYLVYHNLEDNNQRYLNFSRLSFNGSTMVANQVGLHENIGVSLPTFYSYGDEEYLNTEGDFDLSENSTEDSFTVEYNVTGEGKMIFGYQDSSNYAYIEFVNNKISVVDVKNGVEQKAYEVELIKEYDTTVMHTFRLQYKDGYSNLYFDSMEKAAKINCNLPKGRIGYLKNNNFDEIGYTAFSKYALGSSDSAQYNDTVSLANSYDERLSYLTAGSGIVASTDANGTRKGGNNLLLANEGDRATYRMYAKTDGNYNINLRLSSTSIAGNVKVRIDDGELITCNLSENQATKYADGDLYLTILNTYLDAGLHNISIYQNGSPIEISEVRYTKLDLPSDLSREFTDENSLDGLITRNTKVYNDGIYTDNYQASGVITYENFSNATISADLLINSVQASGYAGLIFNVTDYSKNHSADGDGGDNPNMFKGYKFVFESDRVSLIYTDFNYSYTLKSKMISYDSSSVTTMKVVQENNIYHCYINDEVVFDVIGNYGNLEGQVGVYTSNSDVVIKTLDITY